MFVFFMFKTHFS